MKNAGENVFGFGLLSTANNFRILGYTAEPFRIWKRREIRLAEFVVAGHQHIFKPLAAVMLIDIIVEFTERAPGTVLKLYDDLHTRYEWR